MKEVKVWADIHSTGLFDRSGEYYLQNETTISDETWNELQKWVEEYDFVAVMNAEERKGNVKVINNLDKRGIELMCKISKEWPKDGDLRIKFVYYSEGLLEKITFIDSTIKEEE